MKIEVLTKVKDSVDGQPTTLEVGDIRTVPDSDAWRFIGHGWAKEHPSGAASQPASGSVDLDIQNGVLGQTTTL